MGSKYWPLALQDTVSKYNFRTHDTTGRTPLHDWRGVDETPKRLLIFGQLGIVHRHSATKTKLEPRGQWTRYVYPVNRKRIMAVDQHGVFHVVR